MTKYESGALILEEPIGSAVDIESHLFATRTADLYRAIDRSDGSSISLWLLRGFLLPQEVQPFLDRLTTLENLRLPNCPMRGYGVDSEGRAFAVFAPIDAGSVISGNLDSREAERRFAPCLQTLERLHQAAFVVGDLCSHTFVVDRSGRVLFVGVIGDPDFELDRNSDGSLASIPSETLQYFAPEQREGQRATSATDIFAIGVLGFRLFSGKYPFPNSFQNLNSGVPIPNAIPLSSVASNTPVWTEEALSKCLHINPEVRYADAAELGVAIHALRQKAMLASEVPLQVNRQLTSGNSKFQQRQETASTFKPLGDRKKADAPPPSSAKAFLKPVYLIGGALALSLIALLFIFTRGSGIQGSTVSPEVQGDLAMYREAGTDPKMKAAIEVISQKKTSLETRAQKLQELVNSDDPLAHEVIIASAVEAPEPEFREIAHKALLDRVKRLGATRSSEQLRQWLRTIPAGPLPEIYEPMLKMVNPRQPKEAREALLRQAYPRDPKWVLRFAAAIALDSPNPQDYQSVLAQLVGDSLDLKDAAQRSTLSLLLAQPEIAAIYGEDVLVRKSELPDQDLPWVLSLLASRNDLNIRQFAQLTLERGQLSPIRRIFLDAVKERDDLSMEVIISLVRAGSGSATSEDIAQFGRWVDSLSEKILLTLVADLQDPVLIGEAFDTLAAKSMSIEPATALVQLVRDKYWEKRVELAPLIAVASLPGLVTPETVIGLVNRLESYVKDGKLVELLASGGDPVLSKTILERFSASLNLPVLLKLLRHDDKNIRMMAVVALKRFNDIGALKLIIQQYEKEKDPEVRKVFKESFWMIAQRSD